VDGGDKGVDEEEGHHPEDDRHALDEEGHVADAVPALESADVELALVVVVAAAAAVVALALGLDHERGRGGHAALVHEPLLLLLGLLLGLHVLLQHVDVLQQLGPHVLLLVRRRLHAPNSERSHTHTSNTAHAHTHTHQFEFVGGAFPDLDLLEDGVDVGPLEEVVVRFPEVKQRHYERQRRACAPPNLLVLRRPYKRRNATRGGGSAPGAMW
jgi:hypothetical protein